MGEFVGGTAAAAPASSPLSPRTEGPTGQMAPYRATRTMPGTAKAEEANNHQQRQARAMYGVAGKVSIRARTYTSSQSCCVFAQPMGGARDHTHERSWWKLDRHRILFSASDEDDQPLTIICMLAPVGCQ